MRDTHKPARQISSYPCVATQTFQLRKSKLRRRICSWRKVEEAKTMSCRFPLKPLKTLALPRGYGERVQKHR
jgi:hypothetical protein